jgi:Fe-S cluster assembly scaffold protein SufB
LDNEILHAQHACGSSVEDTTVTIVGVHNQSMILSSDVYDLSRTVCSIPAGVVCKISVNVIDTTLDTMRLRIILERDSNVHLSVNINSPKLRMCTIDILPQAEHGVCTISGRYYAHHNQTLQLYTRQVHDIAHATSTVAWKGLAYAASTVDVSGLITIAQQACGTSAVFSSKALLLGAHAQVTGKPYLEINNPDVICKHGHAVGPLDAEQLLYAQARGSDVESARELLIAAFMLERSE